MCENPDDIFGPVFADEHLLTLLHMRRDGEHYVPVHPVTGEAKTTGYCSIKSATTAVRWSGCEWIEAGT